MKKKTMAALAAACALASAGAWADETFDITLHGTVHTEDDYCYPAACISTVPYEGVLSFTAPDGTDGLAYQGVSFILDGAGNSTDNFGIEYGSVTVYGGRLNSAFFIGQYALLEYANDTLFFQTWGNHDFLEQINASVPEPSNGALFMAGIAGAFALREHRRSGSLRRQDRKDLLSV